MDDLNAARGCLWGAFFGLLLWALIGAAFAAEPFNLAAAFHKHAPPWFTNDDKIVLRLRPGEVPMRHIGIRDSETLATWVLVVKEENYQNALKGNFAAIAPVTLRQTTFCERAWTWATNEPPPGMTRIDKIRQACGKPVSLLVYSWDDGSVIGTMAPEQGCHLYSGQGQWYRVMATNGRIGYAVCSW